MKTLFEYARELGKSIGIVVTSSVTDATPAGFFAHVADRGNQEDIISEMVDFDGAVGAGLDFARQNGKTLIVVTADHETGGFAVHDGSIQTRQVTASGFTTGGHTAAMVPLFADGPGSSAFSGIQDNAQIGQTLIDMLLKKKTGN